MRFSAISAFLRTTHFSTAMSRPVFPQLGRLAYGADYNPEQWPRTV